MAEIVVSRKRGVPTDDYDVITGTTVITVTNGNTEVDSSAITFSPLLNGTPLLKSLAIEKVVETSGPTRGAVSVELKAGTTLSSTTMTLTLLTADPNGGGKSVAFTVRYTLYAKVRNS